MSDYCCEGAGLHPWLHFTHIQEGGSQDRTFTVITSTAPQFGHRGVSGADGGFEALGMLRRTLAHCWNPKCRSLYQATLVRIVAEAARCYRATQ